MKLFNNPRIRKDYLIKKLRKELIRYDESLQYKAHNKAIRKAIEIVEKSNN